MDSEVRIVFRPEDGHSKSRKRRSGSCERTVLVGVFTAILNQMHTPACHRTQQLLQLISLLEKRFFQRDIT